MVVVRGLAVLVVGVGRVAMWVAAVAVAAAVVEGEAMVVTSTLGMVVVTTSLSRTQWMRSQSVAKLVLLPSTCVVMCGAKSLPWLECTGATPTQ